MNMVIDRDTFAKVLEAEPTVPTAPDVLGKLVVKTLESETLNPLYAEIISMETGVFSILAGQMARRINSPDVSAAMAGRIMTRMGLRSVRTRNGIRYYWNRKQLVLLKNALGV